jgi:hypothetical protein
MSSFRGFFIYNGGTAFFTASSGFADIYLDMNFQGCYWEIQYEFQNTYDMKNLSINNLVIVIILLLGGIIIPFGGNGLVMD